VNFLEATRPWKSSAGTGPVLRGRRVDNGQPVIHFLSGNGFCGGVYWPFLQKFLPQYGLFLHDIEGHGESDAPARFSGTQALAERTVQVIEDRGLGKGAGLVGMGHSRGAAMTLKIAADNPGLFKALVLLDPIILPTPVWLGWRAASILGFNSMANDTRKRRTAWPSRDDAFAHLKGRGIFKGWQDEAVACFVDYAMKAQEGQWVLRCPPELEAQIYEHPVYPWPSFRKAQLPILFLHGDRSYEFFPWAARVAGRHPQVTVATAPGRHCFMLEHPEDAHLAVTRFLGGLGVQDPSRAAAA
jgi:pimeloyl-ACP methyl ester carboxylesterase